MLGTRHALLTGDSAQARGHRAAFRSCVHSEGLSRPRPPEREAGNDPGPTEEMGDKRKGHRAVCYTSCLFCHRGSEMWGHSCGRGTCGGPLATTLQEGAAAASTPRSRPPPPSDARPVQPVV